MASNVNPTPNKFTFNPHISVEDFQKILQSTDTSEEEIKKAAYCALASKKADELATGLDDTLAGKIKTFEKARNKEILDFVKRLNTLADSKSDYLEANSHYSQYKDVFAHLKKIAYNIEASDLEELTEEIEKIGPQALKALDKIKAIQSMPCCKQSPIAALSHAFNDFNRLLNEEENNNSNEENSHKKETAINFIKLAIRYSLADGFSHEDLKSRLQYFCSEPSNYAIFEEQFPIAQQEYIEIKAKEEAEKEQKRKEMKASLVNQLTIVQKNYDQFKVDPTYQKFSTEKQVLIEKLQILSTFCFQHQIRNHDKIYEGSKSRLDRFIYKS